MKILKQIFTIAFIGLALSACKKEDNLIFDIQPRHFLSDDTYKSLSIEIIAVEGHEPNSASLDNLEDFLNERLNKPKGISFTQKTIPSPENYSYSAEDLRLLEDQHRTQYAQNENLTAYIYYADAEYSENTDQSEVIGLAYGSTSMCIFEETVADNSGGFGQVSRNNLETAVLIHEFGHVLGLVNNGTPMTQNHESAPGHCDNENCLMYYASETGSLTGFIGGDPMPELDAQCLADLKANGGK
ncbi:MAG: membrane metalloprotease [Crocinitomicaceae bacterium]